MPSLIPWNPLLPTRASSTPRSFRGAAPTSPTSRSEKAKSFSGGDPTTARSARPGPPTRTPLSALLLAVSLQPPCPAMAWKLINAVPAWRPPKEGKSWLSSIACACDVQYPFGLHTWLCTHIARYFYVNFAPIPRNPNFESNVLYYKFHMNFAPISLQFHMATVQLSQQKFACWSRDSSSFHAERRFKPHTCAAA